jgi:hypothetical protein
MAQRIVNKYTRMVEVLSKGWCSGGASGYTPGATPQAAFGVITVVDDVGNRKNIAQWKQMRMGNLAFQANHGGIWKTENVQLNASELRTPIGQMTHDSFSTSHEIHSAEQITRSLKAIVQFRHRVHKIARSVLHNLALEIGVDVVNHPIR